MSVTIDDLVAAGCSALEAKLVAHMRAANPTMRTSRLVRRTKTGTISQYACAWCGAYGPTYSGKYRETKRSVTWRAVHTASHLVDVDAELVAFDAAIEARS